MSRLRDDIAALDEAQGALEDAAYRAPGDEEAWRCGRPELNPGSARPARRNPGTTVRVGDLYVHAYRIIGTPHVIFECYERTRAYSTHSSFLTIDGKHMGRVGTRALPPEIDALPGPYTPGVSDQGAARLAAVKRFQRDQYEECYRAILETFPEAAHGKRRDGEIEVTDAALADRLDPEPWRQSR